MPQHLPALRIDPQKQYICEPRFPPIIPLEQKILPPKRGKPRAYCPFLIQSSWYSPRAPFHYRAVIGKPKTHMETGLTTQPTSPHDGVAIVVEINCQLQMEIYCQQRRRPAVRNCERELCSVS